jgi:hypothetical protein
MRGKAVTRRPDLVLLSTTGLFSGGSSQYNRIRVPAARLGGGEGEVRYVSLKQGTAYSTFHFSQATMREMRIYAEQWHHGSDVHGIFGEGVNPKMRKIRESLDRIGLPSDEVLQSGSARALYVVPLAHNFRQVLLGREPEPAYILPDQDPRAVKQIAKHTLTYPMLHGAAVALPEPDDALATDGEQLELDDLFASDLSLEE